MGWLFLRRPQRGLRCPRGRSPRGPAFLPECADPSAPEARGSKHRLWNVAFRGRLDGACTERGTNRPLRVPTVQAGSILLRIFAVCCDYRGPVSRRLPAQAVMSRSNSVATSGGEPFRRQPHRMRDDHRHGALQRPLRELISDVLTGPMVSTASRATAKRIKPAAHAAARRRGQGLPA